MKRIVILPVCLALGVAVLVLLFTFEPSEENDFGGPFIPVEAEVLARSYRENPTEADQRYKGKGVALTGKITGIGGEFTLRADLKDVSKIWNAKRSLGYENAILFTDDLRIFCVSSPKHESGFIGLAPEMVVRIEGVCEGLRVPADIQPEMKLIFVSQCRVVAKLDGDRKP
ncbi:MAG TPA: hypothetical protein VFE62_05285 [Gemmataceae bacterium]|nr:hypothetical protein [Gemmataceae bacterium]